MKRTLNAVTLRSFAAAMLSISAGTAIAAKGPSDLDHLMTFMDAYQLGDPIADINGDGWVNGDDFDMFTRTLDVIGADDVQAIDELEGDWSGRPSDDGFLAAFEAGDDAADINGDGWVNGDDFDAYARALDVIDGQEVDADDTGALGGFAGRGAAPDAGAPKIVVGNMQFPARYEGPIHDSPNIFVSSAALQQGRPPAGFPVMNSGNPVSHH